MRSPRTPLLGVAVLALVGGLVAPQQVLAAPAGGAPTDSASVEVDGVPVLVRDGQVGGLLAPASDGPVAVQTTSYAGHTLIRPIDERGESHRTTDATAVAAGTASVAVADDADATIAAPSGFTTQATRTPDYCRDPANGRPTTPAPGKVAVTVSAIDRNGASTGGSFTMMDYHCEPYEANGYIAFSVSAGAPRTFYLPPGKYSLIGQITTVDESGTNPQEVTFGGDPQFEVRAGEPTSLVVDARDAEPLVVNTPETSTPSVVVLGWMRGIEDNPPLLESTVIYPQASAVTKISVLAGDPVSDGVFEFFPWIRSTEPWATGRLLGRGGPLDLTLKLVNPLGSQPFSGNTTVRSDVAAVHPGDAVLLTDGPQLATQVRQAQARGAVAALVRPAGPGLTYPSITSPLPVLSVSSEQGGMIAERLAAMRGAVPLRLTADANPDYLYDLVDGLPALTGDPYAGLKADDLTTVQQRFHSDGQTALTLETRSPTKPCTCLLTPVFDLVTPGSTRVDHVIDNGSVWQQTVLNDVTFQARSAPMAYTSDIDDTADWFGGAVGSGLKRGYAPENGLAPATSTDGRIRLNLTATDGDGHGLSGAMTRTGSITRDGQPVTDTFTGLATIDASSGPADWKVALTTEHTTDLWQQATSVSSVWEFTAGGMSTAPQLLSLLDATTRFPVDPTSRRVPGGKLVVRPWRLDGAATTSVTVRVELSRDGGQHWVEQRGHLTGGTWSATPTRGAGPVDVRINVTDDDGTSMSRTIENAWTD